MIGPNDEILNFIDDYLHGLLTPEDAETVRRFCETSRLGRAALEDAQRRYQALKSLPPVPASEDLIRQTVQQVTLKETARATLRGILKPAVLLATAASVLIIGSLHLYYYRLAPSPYDLRLLGQSQVLSGSSASLRVAVFDRHSGQPLGGVPIRLALYNRGTHQEQELAALTTDQRGAASPQFRLPDWDAGRYELRVTARLADREEAFSQPLDLKRDWRLLLTTDKPVYQPGQTIHIRVQGLKKPDLKPVAGHQATFTLTDPKGNVIFKRQEVTSRFGIASADCPLADEIIEGSYQIRCTVGATTSEVTVKVEKYVLPKFKVAVTLDKPFYAPGEQVTCRVQADYFFGQPVAGGEVQIDVRATDVQPYVIATLSKATNAEGSAEFDFRLPDHLVGREQDSGKARFLLVATVTDTAGQKYSTGLSRPVTAEPIRVEVIPESGTLVAGIPNRIYVFTSYADGQPAPTRLVIHGQETEIETSPLGVASFEMTPGTESVGITVKATDTGGRVGRRHLELRCGAASYDFVIRPDRAVYAGGETMQLAVLGHGVEPVFVDLLKDGQTLLTRQIEMQDGRGQYEIDLPAELFGTVEVIAYRFGDQGLAVRKSRAVYVRQARQLAIQAALDQDEYRPGAKAKLTLTLTDSDGQAAPGAIGLKAVDEAVFAVLSQRAGLEQTFFLLEQELLEPVYTLYPGWSPELFTELPLTERVQFEQALFSTTARQAEGPRAIPDAFFGTEARPSSSNVQARLRRERMARTQAADAAATGSRPSPFTLAASSFPPKQAEVNARRQAGLAQVIAAWWSLAGVLALVGVLAFAVSFPKTSGCLLLVGLPCVCLFGASVWIALNAKSRLLNAKSQLFTAAEGAAFASAVPAPAASESAFPDQAGSAPPRVRQWFPETLLWRPELITDDRGQVALEVDLADSITTWRLSASAVTSAGQLGGADFPIKVFQPFFVDLDLPVSLTRHDEVGVPLVVYNYLDQPQTVQLTVKDEPWFQRLAEPESPLSVALAAGEIRALDLPLKVLQVGKHQLEVTATASGVADAIRREIEVVPDGQAVEQLVSGTLAAPLEMLIRIPENAIEGSVQAIVKLYPSTFSQLVEGLDAIFQMPSGCFEQTSSTTYPNVLALDYLRRTGKSVPEVEAKARQYIHLGCQRLVSFEVPGGGFDWFGHAPAHRILTAYGLLEFEDMARVHDVDPQLIQRTRAWLLAQRRPDGSWAAERQVLHDGLMDRMQAADLDYGATAYIAWAVFAGGQASGVAAPTLDYLLARSPDSIADPYLLAVAANGVAAIDPEHARLDAFLARLEGLKQTSPDGKLAWWEQAADGRTAFYGAGQAGQIETTALAALALLKAGQQRATTRAALGWLIAQKDARGTWHSTQATVLSLKALLAGTGAALGGDHERRIDVALGGETVREVVVPADQAEVMQQISLSGQLQPGHEYRLSLTDRSDTEVGYQVSVRYHVPTASEPVQPQPGPLAVDVQYDRQRLPVDETVTAVAAVTNHLPQAAPMVILDLPIPGGFALDAGELDELVGSQQIARYQITPRKAIVYLRQLESGQTLELRYRLRATMPVKVAVPAADAYEYYDPSRTGSGGAARLETF